MEDLTRALGLWSSRAYLVLGVAYVVVIVGGFISNRKDSSVTIDGGLVPSTATAPSSSI